jgi:hypothetical protein
VAAELHSVHLDQILERSDAESLQMGKASRRPEINMSSIPVTGIGGAGLTLVALSMAAVFPEVRWLLVSGLCGGVALAIVLVMMRRR